METKHPGGRPTDYTPEMEEKARALVEQHRDEAHEPKVIPSVATLSLQLGVSRSTVYEWAKQHKEFSDILEDLLALQEGKLLQNGLNSVWNPTITKLMLSKHGYSDKTETDITSGGEPLSPVLVKFIDAKDNRDTPGV